MNHFIYLVLFLNSSEPTCNVNEVYEECGNGCQQTCEDVINNVPIQCEKMCTPNCYCISGYLKNAKGDCVPKSSCQPKGKSCDEYYLKF